MCLKDPTELVTERLQSVKNSHFLYWAIRNNQDKSRLLISASGCCTLFDVCQWRSCKKRQQSKWQSPKQEKMQSSSWFGKTLTDVDLQGESKRVPLSGCAAVGDERPRHTAAGVGVSPQDSVRLGSYQDPEYILSGAWQLHSVVQSAELGVTLDICLHYIMFSSPEGFICKLWQHEMTSHSGLGYSSLSQSRQQVMQIPTTLMLTGHCCV